ncbi:hypothetical protein AB0C61_29305 [Streptomyces sp. NPDC048680]|uniref:hypothetical protein n=1 Tax=Streptomyces sp. NPDC048680 TaxID=3155492 RepID=UPI0034342ED5
MTTTPPQRHTFGTADTECRYPVLLNGHYIGMVFRWHRAWIAIPAGLENEIRVSAGSIGKDAAARYLCDEFDAGRITPHQKYPEFSSSAGISGPAPLLHPRMRATARNKDVASAALQGLSDYRWTALGGYPGADNPWLLNCDLCGWVGPKYWSHLRGRNENPPSMFRHPGCARPQ